MAFVFNDLLQVKSAPYVVFLLKQGITATLHQVEGRLYKNYRKNGWLQSKNL